MQKTLIALACASASLAASADPVILKVAHFWPATALSQQKVLEPWCAKIAQESNNTLQCQIYPSMQLGGTPPQLIQQAIDGVADIVWTLPGYTAGRFPSMEVMELPFLTKDAESGSRAAWEIYQKYGQKDFAGLKALAFHVHDRGQIHNNKRPITKVADFKGLKMRAPTRLTNKMIAALGGHPRGHAHAADPRCRLQGRGRWLRAALGSGAHHEAARDDQVPLGNQPAAARPVHHAVHHRHEPGQVRQPDPRAEKGD